MQGFSDREPEDWDMAVGTVRGFRWWNMIMPMKTESIYDTRISDFYDSSPADIRVEPYFQSTDIWMPASYRCLVQGMHGGHWNRGLTQDGKYKANCAAGPSMIMSVPLHKGSKSVLDPKCGCGFWAYWRELPLEWEACLPYVRYTESRGFQRGGYTLTIPLAGVIEGSGKTVIGERGFRTEYARITDLTFNVDSDCLYYDERRPVNQEMYYGYVTTTAMSSPWLPGGLGRNPCNAGNFSRFVQRELGTPPDMLMASVKDIVKNILGSDMTWHSDITALLKNCPPDKNYG